MKVLDVALLILSLLPVFRDDTGAFGTPTSDSVRTMISEKTQNILFIFIGFAGKDELESILMDTKNLLTQYAAAKRS